MLPGVECARRRRLHQRGGWSDSPRMAAAHASTRRSSLSLYATNHESHLSSVSSLQQRCTVQKQAYEDEKLGGVARQAKERLDERLRAQYKSQAKRNNNKRGERLVCTYQGRRRGCQIRDLQKEAFGLKKITASRRLGMISWGKLQYYWKGSKENHDGHHHHDECAICLDQLIKGDGETLSNLPYTHCFHSRCLERWLETNAQCPYCRTGNNF